MCAGGSRRTGFVLLEAMVALMVIALVGGAALSVAAGGMRVSGRAGHLLEARSLAEDRLAALRLLAPPDIDRIPDSLAAGRFAAPFDAYEWVAFATPVRNEYRLFEIGVRVRWGDGSFDLQTLLYRPTTGPRVDP